MKIEPVRSVITKHTRIIEQNPKRGELVVKTKCSSGVSFLSIPVLIFSFVSSGKILMTLEGVFDLDVNGLEWLFWSLIIFGGIWTGIIKLCWILSEIRLVVTPNTISFGGKNYDRSQWGGFTDYHSVNDFIDELYFSYGGIEEKKRLGFRANPRAMVDYLNDFVNSVPHT